ncbi:MAG: hypothetical protein J5752_03805 [Clostridiales bacterium]|nr:hypothetical protein [Clostridiales bacterium]
MADSIKCPNCSANLVFDADRQKMYCEYCLSTFDPEVLKNTILPETDEKSNAGERTHKKGAKKRIRKALGDDGQVFICNACGASVVADKNTSATFCAFCGSPALLNQRLTEEFSPDYIIPFKYGKDEAVKKFFSWCKGGRWTPIDFVSDKNIEKLTGLYVPFWLYNVESLVDIRGEGATESSYTHGNTTTVTTTYYDVHRKEVMAWSKIPLDGATRIDDDLMEAIEPFKYKEMRKFDPAYMQGFFAERYDLSGDDLKPRLIDRLKKYISQEISPTVRQYNKFFKVKDDNTVIYEPEMLYAMMPVWFLHYKYSGKDYYFCMNGQTGEVAGVAPVSWVKRLVLFFALLAVLAVVGRFIIGLILGGFVG